MTLHVPFEQFSKTVLRMLTTKDVFVSAHGSGTLVTATDGHNDVLVASHTDLTIAQTKVRLMEADLEPHDGVWKLGDLQEVDCDERCEAYISAVSYKSSESMPGVWVDAHRTQPTEVQVLRVMYDEFRETGELNEVSFEEFVRLSEPNVVIVPPYEIQRYLAKKSEPC